MTKNQVAKKLNAIIKKHTKAMNAEANAVLKKADMWYGDEWFISHQMKEYPKSKDRHGDQFINDGMFEVQTDIDKFLWTKDEAIEALNSND